MKNKKKLIKAEQKFVRISPQKMRKVVEVIKKFSPVEALENLQFLNKKAARILRKVLKQAISNAVNNHNLKADNLQFSEIQIGKGPTLKRWRPVSRGRAHSILKRTSHVKVVLKEEEK